MTINVSIIYLVIVEVFYHKMTSKLEHNDSNLSEKEIEKIGRCE